MTGNDVWILLRGFWCFLAIIVSGIALAIGSVWHPNAASITIGAAAVVISIVALTAVIGESLRARWAQASVMWIFLAGSVTGLSPALVRAVLPWEEPGTYEGSPLATLISIIMLAVVFGVVVTIPMFVLAFVGTSRAEPALTPRGSPAPRTPSRA